MWVCLFLLYFNILLKLIKYEIFEFTISYTFIDSPTFCLSMSIFITFTFTMSPTDTISDGFFMNLSLISEICTSPSCFTPMSINAPKSITFLTVPVSIIPSFKSSNFRHLN